MMPIRIQHFILLPIRIRIPTPSFTHVGVSEKKLDFIYSSSGLHCFIFLIKAIGVMLFNIFWTVPYVQDY